MTQDQKISSLINKFIDIVNQIKFKKDTRLKFKSGITEMPNGVSCGDCTLTIQNKAVSHKFEIGIHGQRTGECIFTEFKISKYLEEEKLSVKTNPEDIFNILECCESDFISIEFNPKTLEPNENLNIIFVSGVLPFTKQCTSEVVLGLMQEVLWTERKIKEYLTNKEQAFNYYRILEMPYEITRPEFKLEYWPF